MASALLASFLISLLSFSGILVLTKKVQKLQSALTVLIAFASGTILGNAFFHLLPEFLHEYRFDQWAAIYVIAGILMMMLVEAYFHCSHDSSHELACTDSHHKHAHLAGVNLLGDALHNFLDGIAIAASFMVSFEVGVMTAFAIALHEIPQEIADVAVLQYSGWDRAKILWANFGVALTAILGVIVAYVLGFFVESVTSVLIPIAFGQFIYIALADLMPEIHRKAGVKKYVIEITAFLIGTGIFLLLSNLLADFHVHG